MSAELAIKEIQRFLASGEAEVLCVKGRWGVGKTYAWRHYLEDAQEKGKLPKADYAYVSLFGLNSQDALRHAIFESTVSHTKAKKGTDAERSEEHTSELKSIMRISYAVLRLKQKTHTLLPLTAPTYTTIPTA